VPSRSENGIALVEILVALSLLAIGFLSLVATLAQNARLQRITHEKHLAVLGAESILEDLRRADFRELVAEYGGSKRHFDLVGLSPQSGDADGRVGRILFVLDETATDSVAQAFELPRDLNGDGDALDASVKADYRILPVRIQVDWHGAGGNSTIEVRAVLIAPEDVE
jgi:type II secretory pathway component PulJ